MTRIRTSALRVKEKLAMRCAYFKTRYATLSFMHDANLDEGAAWRIAFALKELTVTEEARIGALVKKAVS